MNIFYISYDGLTDLVSRSQVIPYLEGLSKKRNNITFLSFEKPENERAAEVAYYRARLKDNGIEWIGRRYHKSPSIPATALDILQGIITGASVIKNKKIDIIHARGYVAAFMGISLKLIFGTRIIFDMRGFWADEKIDAGNWHKDSMIYLTVKKLEKILISKSDAIIVLTEAAKTFITKTYPVRSSVTVIPCCVDTAVFNTAAKAGSRSPGRRIMVYVGNLGSFYGLEQILGFFRFFKKQDDTFFLRIISNYPKEVIAQRASLKNIGAGDYCVDSLDYRDVPGAFSQAELSLIFYNRRLSGIGCCPIKFAESLASGVPVAISSGIGDCEKIINDDKIGVVLHEFSESEYKSAYEDVEGFSKEREYVSRRCRQAAERLFSLERGIEKYQSVYEQMKR